MYQAHSLRPSVDEAILMAVQKPFLTDLQISQIGELGLSLSLNILI